MTRPHSVDYSEEARNDLASIQRYIARENPTAAGAFVQSIRDRVDLLSDQPLIGHRRHTLPRRFRVLTLDRKVTVVYAVQHQKVDVLRVFYGGQDYDAILAKQLKLKRKPGHPT